MKTKINLFEIEIMTDRISLLPFLFLLFTLVCTHLSAQPLSTVSSFTNVQEVDLYIIAGSLEIIPSGSDQLVVEGYYEEERIEVRIQQTGDQLVIKESSPQRNNNGYSTWKIAVPDGMAIKVNIGAGGVTAENFRGSLSGSNGTGGLKLIGGKGTIQWSSGTGDIIASGFDGTLHGSSGTGMLTFKNSSGSFNASSGTGNVRASQLTVTSPSAFSSGTGDVYYSFRSSLEAKVSVNSGTGKAQLDLNGQEFNGTLIMRCNEKKGRIKAPFSFTEETTKGRGKKTTLVKIKRFGNDDFGMEVTTGTGTATVIQ